MIERNTERTVSSREWCCKDILAETGKLRDIPVDEWECWVEELREKGDFFISSRPEEYGSGRKTSSILEFRAADSLMAAPIMVNGAVVGVLGVDNPRRNTGDLLFCLWRLLFAAVIFLLTAWWIPERKRSRLTGLRLFSP